MKQELERIFVISSVILILLVAALLLVGFYFGLVWLVAEFPQASAAVIVAWFCYVFFKDIV